MTLTIARGMLMAVAALVAQGATSQRDVGRIAETGRASIAGVVVADDQTRAPIRRAALTLTRAGADVPQMTVSDDSGRFAFEALPAGVYTLSAAKGGYVSASYGATKPGLPGSPIPIRDGQRFDTGRIPLARGAAIAGRLLSAKGRPVLYGMVEAVPVQTVNGERRRRLVAGAPPSVATNAHGDYRIFGLAPGDYLVSAQTTLTFMNQESREATANELRWAQQLIAGGPTGLAPTAAEPPRSRPVAYASTYFPGTTDLTAAAIITVGRGEERVSLDFQIQFVPTARVSGMVIGPDGQPAPRVAVSRSPRLADNVLPNFGVTRSSTAGSDGNFVMAGVSPGGYVLTARTATHWGVADVSVNGDDLDNIAIRLQPGMSVTGRFAIDGTSPPPAFDRFHITLTSPPDATSSPASQKPTVVRPDGSFTIEGAIPGSYRLRVSSPPVLAAVWTPRSALLDARDVLDLAFEIRPGVDVTGVAVTLTDRPTELAGTMVDATGQPTPQFHVVVFAIDRQYWTRDSRRIQSVRAGADGTFSVRGLPAGEYFLAAMTEVDPAQLQDASFLEQVAAASLKITLVDGEKRTQTLRVGG